MEYIYVPSWALLVVNNRSVSSQTEKMHLAGLKFDILNAPLENEKLIDTYIKLFTDAIILGKGIVKVDL